MTEMDGQYIRLYHGAYKYAITQTFAIPTIDDAEKGNVGVEIEDTINEEVIEKNMLNEEKMENLIENPSIQDFDSIFKLGNKSA